MTGSCGLCRLLLPERDLVQAKSYGARLPFNESLEGISLLCPECSQTKASHCPVCKAAFLVEECGQRDTKYERADYDRENGEETELLACPSCDPGGDWDYLDDQEEDDLE